MKGRKIPNLRPGRRFMGRAAEHTYFSKDEDDCASASADATRSGRGFGGALSHSGRWRRLNRFVLRAETSYRLVKRSYRLAGDDAARS